MPPIRILILHATGDQSLVDRLVKHCATMVRQNLITITTQGQIMAGVDIQEEIRSCIDQAQVILLCVSPGFIASDMCYRSTKEAMMMHAQGSSRIIPLRFRPVSPSDWKAAKFNGLKAIPDEPDKTLIKSKNLDGLMSQIVESIRTVIGTIR